MRQFTVLGLAALLAACGGGGDSAPVTRSAAEGLWWPAGITGNAVVVVLEDGETWGLYINTAQASIETTFHGQSSASGGLVSGAGREFGFVAPRTIKPAGYSGTVKAQNRLALTFSSSSLLPAATYAYNAAYQGRASLSALAGTYMGPGVSAAATEQTLTVTAWPTGAITVPATQGCSAAGSATPRRSGQNVFDVALTFTGTTCPLGNGAYVSGIGYYDLFSRQFAIMALTPDQSDGFFYLGKK